MSTRFTQLDPSTLHPVTQEELLQYFMKAGRPPQDWRVGVELERLVVDRQTLLQLPFDGPGGVESLLQAVSERFGWRPFYENGRLIALLREGASITLEPGGQVEYSSAPLASLFDIRDELLRHHGEFQAVIDKAKAAWLGVGLTPFSRIEQITLVPKQRYGVMDHFLPKLGSHARHMMRGTCSIQVSLDFEDEADACRKTLVALSLSPIVNAIFGNSPLLAGELSGAVSYRAHVWQHMDPARSGQLGDDVRWDDFSFQRWVDYLLDRPMMFYVFGTEYVPAHGRTFRDWMERGFEGVFPTMEDWEMHLTSIFPDVRIKKYIEVRGADCVGWPLTVAVPAIWKGIFYDSVALEGAERLGRTIQGPERRLLVQEAAAEGLRGEWKGRSLAELAREVLELAAEGLSRQATLQNSADEAELLTPAFEVVDSGMTPGARLLSRWPELEGRPDLILEELAFLRGH